ncbi:WXG100 family type VII secretion target [Amycolatopsis rhabdoformis]|uniref:ESAT-6-like protein n=1 Tax=Amycolatopsis rhabdoformis TaxID=1448059 RepID=A0ABZ1I418_9PSEU|nr:WXG100 family type VII secretion target [Amycolatopsis rhabdoformis]WSE29158.1 WXG100 family type VII secretion target [Amycolatopsis rhabdoformis]
MARILVDPATIHRAADDCNATTKDLKSSFDRLKDDLHKLTDTWSGDAKDNYMKAQQDWDDKFADLTQLLAQIAIALPEIADGYTKTDKDVQNLF